MSEPKVLTPLDRFSIVTAYGLGDDVEHWIPHYEATVADLERRLADAEEERDGNQECIDQMTRELDAGYESLTVLRERIAGLDDKHAKNAEDAGDAGWFREQGREAPWDEEG